jgi:hypothetical protein
MTTAIGRLIAASRGRGRAPGHPRMRRIVVRMDAAEVGRLDAQLPRFPESTRASLVRAFCFAGLAVAEEALPEAPAAAEGAPEAPASNPMPNRCEP